MNVMTYRSVTGNDSRALWEVLTSTATMPGQPAANMAADQVLEARYP